MVSLYSARYIAVLQVDPDVLKTKTSVTLEEQPTGCKTQYCTLFRLPPFSLTMFSDTHLLAASTQRRLANQGLQDIYDWLGGESWRCRNGWLDPGSDVREWYGLTITPGGDLVSINLISNNLEVRYYPHERRSHLGDGPIHRH